MTRTDVIVPTEYERTNRYLIGGLLIVLGALVLFVRDDLLLTPAHRLFFDSVPRWLVGLCVVAAGVAVLGPLIWPTFRRGLSVFAVDAISLLWAGVAVYPVTHHGVGNVVSVVSWALVAACAHRMLMPEGMRRHPEGP